MPVSTYRLSKPLGLLFAAALGALPGASAVAQGITTTGQLRQACEQSPNNTVFLANTTKIIDGFRPPATELVNSDCTLALAQGAALEFESVSMTFAGAFEVVSLDKGEIKLTRASLHADSIRFDLPGAGSSIVSDRSSMGATEGDLDIQFQHDAKMEFKDRLLPGPSYGLLASGAVRISGQSNLTAMLAQTVVDTSTGFFVAMNGMDGNVFFDDVLIYGRQGSFEIASPSPKGVVGLHATRVRVRDSARISLTGEDCKIGMKQTRLGSDGVEDPLGAFVIETGTKGNIEATETTLAGGTGGVLVQTSQQGGVKFEDSSAFALGEVLVLAGAQGTMTVKDSVLYSELRITIATGFGGSCEATSNSYNAPVVEVCPVEASTTQTENQEGLARAISSISFSS